MRFFQFWHWVFRANLTNTNNIYIVIKTHSIQFIKFWSKSIRICVKTETFIDFFLFLFIILEVLLLVSSSSSKNDREVYKLSSSPFTSLTPSSAKLATGSTIIFQSQNKECSLLYTLIHYYWLWEVWVPELLVPSSLRPLGWPVPLWLFLLTLALFCTIKFYM